MPPVGTRKIVTKFLWLPKKIGDETRWLERARILMEFREVEGPDWEHHRMWCIVCWAD